MERPPSTPILVILSGSLPLLWKRPVLTRRGSSNDDSCSSLKPPTPHSLLVLIVCLHATFCFCPSVHALLSDTHTHFPLILALTPASLPTHTPTKHVHTSWPLHFALPMSKFTLRHMLSNVVRWCCRQDQEALHSICRRGQSFILYYVVVMGPDRGPPKLLSKGNWGSETGRGRGVGGRVMGCLLQL